jgi:hypothetical protein
MIANQRIQPNVKIKKESEMCLESVVYRLNAIGLNSYPISLPDAIKQATVEWKLISTHYSGAVTLQSTANNFRTTCSFVSSL